jgi:hypothetical protein
MVQISAHFNTWDLIQFYISSEELLLEIMFCLPTLRDLERISDHTLYDQRKFYFIGRCNLAESSLLSVKKKNVHHLLIKELERKHFHKDAYQEKCKL